MQVSFGHLYFLRVQPLHWPVVVISGPWVLLDVSDGNTGRGIFDEDAIKKVYEVRVSQHRVVRLFIKQRCDMHIHILVIEGVFQSHHEVEHYTARPYIRRLSVIGPRNVHFRAEILECACLLC